MSNLLSKEHTPATTAKARLVVPDYLAETAAFITQYEGALKVLVSRACRDRIDLRDEAWSDVILHYLPRIFELWQRDRPFWPYAKRNLQFYLFKWYNRHMKRHAASEYSDALDLRTYEHKDGACLAEFMSILDEDQQQFVFMHFVLDATLEEIRWELDLGKKGIRNLRLEVYNLAREYYDPDGSERALMLERSLRDGAPDDDEDSEE